MSIPKAFLFHHKRGDVPRERTSSLIFELVPNNGPKRFIQPKNCHAKKSSCFRRGKEGEDLTERAEMPIVSEIFFFVTQCPKFMAVFLVVVVVLML